MCSRRSRETETCSGKQAVVRSGDTYRREDGRRVVL